MLGIHAFAAVIDDPKVQELETKAIDWLREAIQDKQVRVMLGQVPKDTHGRYLAYLESSGDDINRKLIAEGRAVVYTEYPFERESAYFTAESQARSQKTGVWATEAAAKLVKGLRVQWQQSRNDPKFIDPLLAPGPDAVTKEALP
ncbi:MAG: thermonuclease family protein [Myxococcota bacterium]